MRGNVSIRYLPAGVAVGDPKPEYLTVGTYPKTHALRTVESLARRPGHPSERIDGGGLAVSSSTRPQSIYFAYPGSNVQIEVYDPSPKVARRLVVSRKVKPLR
jgi:hypothetical protein